MTSYAFSEIIQFNSILYYLCAESTATRPITDTAQRKYNNNNNNNIIIIIITIIIIIIIIVGKVKTPFNDNVLTIMMIIIIGQNNLLPISLI
jgi:hypothetical protein